MVKAGVRFCGVIRLKQTAMKKTRLAKRCQL